MRLAFVHGINNEDITPEDIENVWWEAILRGWQDLGLTPKPNRQSTLVTMENARRCCSGARIKSSRTRWYWHDPDRRSRFS
jgi:hypothetical protein